MNRDNFLASYLSPEETVEIQAKIMRLLSKEILYYTGGKSSSVTVETAQKLLESALYSITLYLDSQSEPYTAIKTESLEDIRQKGLELVKLKVEEAKQLLKEVRETRTPTDLIAYNGTIDVALEGFFQLYDPRFEAQSTAAVIDYPLSKDDMSVTGILYIISYLTQLKKENEFCAKYSKNHIRALLFAHGAKHHLDYREMLVNIPEIILEYEKSRKKTGGKRPPVSVTYSEKPDQ
jgi:hypothetical protein